MPFNHNFDIKATSSQTQNTTFVFKKPIQLNKNQNNEIKTPSTYKQNQSLVCKITKQQTKTTNFDFKVSVTQESDITIENKILIPHPPRPSPTVPRILPIPEG